MKAKDIPKLKDPLSYRVKRDQVILWSERDITT